MTKSLRRIFGLPIGLVAAFAPASTAAAQTVIGSPSQTSNEQASTGQVGSQTAGGGVVIGDVSQSGSNAASTDLSNHQKVANGIGSIVVGNPSQQSSQSAGTSQTLAQVGASGGVHVGDTSQSGSNHSSTAAASGQSVASGSALSATGGTVILGSPTQQNSQTLVTGQQISQDPSGGVIVGDVSQSGSNSSSSSARNRQRIGDVTCFLICPTATVLGSPNQQNHQTTGTSQVIDQSTAGGVIVGSVAQSQSNSSLVTLRNHQDVEVFMK